MRRAIDPTAKGEFANNKVPGYQAAQWTLFDAAIVSHYAEEFVRKFEETGVPDVELLEYADAHLKRLLSFITPEASILEIQGKGNEPFSIPKGVLPEAFAWDSRREMWVANHNSPLHMAQALCGIAFARYLEASTIYESMYKASTLDLAGLTGGYTFKA